MKSVALALASVGLAVAVTSQAAPITSSGAGSAVIGTPSFVANFDAIPQDTSLLNYTEGGVLASVDDTQCCFNKAHYGNGGNASFVTIAAESGATFGAIEVSVGSGYSVGTHNIVWETLRGGLSTGSGIIQVNGIGYADADTDLFAVLGWSDVDLFDTLRLGAAPTSTSYDAFGEAQAIAIDSVRIGDASGSAVPEPASLVLVGFGLAALAFRRRRG